MSSHGQKPSNAPSLALYFPSCLIISPILLPLLPPCPSYTPLAGGTTVLPSLRSYSIFTGVGIIFTYLLQLTFFLAFFTLDQKRIDAKRDGMFCWK